MKFAYLADSKFPWYDSEQRAVICPIAVDHNEKERLLKIKQLQQLGGQILGEVKMPLDFGYQFLRYELPDWLRLSSLESANYGRNQTYSFVGRGDSDDLERLCVTTGFMMNTNIWTRYHPHSRVISGHGKGQSRVNSKVMSIVQDLEKIDPDIDDHDHTESIIWEIEVEGVFLHGGDEPAKAWLDQNYPDWRNPMAYWSSDVKDASNH